MYSFHVHSTYCHGENSPEEIVKAAIEKSFVSIGFSSHGYTDYDTSYCLRDEEGYIAEIRRLQQKYKDELQIYLGVEEDAFGLIDKNRFDYIIGSAHYVRKENQYYPVDLDSATLKECINLFDNNMLAFADAYYRDFCEYIKYRKPNIIGHFDLITKFDEMESSIFLQNPKYNELAEKYIRIAAENDCIFEVNTGAISRGYRKTPYPSENLLHVLKTLNAKIMLTSDSHSADTLDFGYEETTTHLKDIGFTSAYTLLDNEFKKYDL